VAFLLEPYPEDILARVKHDYPPDEVADVLAILSGVKDLGWHIPWIQLAALALAGGKKSLIQQWIDLANEDPRDLNRMADALLGIGWERDYILYSERQCGGDISDREAAS
jgi:hypothetical protein